MCTSEVAAKLKVKTLKWENHSDHDLNSHFTHSEIFIKNVRYSQETKNSKNINFYKKHGFNSTCITIIEQISSHICPDFHNDKNIVGL